jgi:hypothetical protein
MIASAILGSRPEAIALRARLGQPGELLRNGWNSQYGFSEPSRRTTYRSCMEGAMEQTVVLTLARSDAETLVSSLRRRGERLCDIRRELCEPEPEEFEREELAYFEQESQTIERILALLQSVLRTAAENEGARFK